MRPGPRATTRSFKKSYSGRRSSEALILDLFFIGVSFTAGCLPRANHTNALRPLGIRDYEKPSLAGPSHKNKAVLFVGVIGSLKTTNNGSSNAVLASSKLTSCFLRFDSALRLPHLNGRLIKIGPAKERHQNVCSPQHRISIIIQTRRIGPNSRARLDRVRGDALRLRSPIPRSEFH